MNIMYIEIQLPTYIGLLHVVYYSCSHIRLSYLRMVTRIFEIHMYISDCKYIHLVSHRMNKLYTMVNGTLHTYTSINNEFHIFTCFIIIIIIIIIIFIIIIYDTGRFVFRAEAPPPPLSYPFKEKRNLHLFT